MTTSPEEKWDSAEALEIERMTLWVENEIGISSFIDEHIIRDRNFILLEQRFSTIWLNTEYSRFFPFLYRGTEEQSWEPLIHSGFRLTFLRSRLCSFRAAASKPGSSLAACGGEPGGGGAGGSTPDNNFDGETKNCSYISWLSSANWKKLRFPVTLS